jgi:transposase
MRKHTPLCAHDTERKLLATLKRITDPTHRLRLKAIIFRKQGENPQDIAKRLLISDRAVRAWITLYNNSGLEGLVPKPPGRKKGNPKWDASIFDALTEEIDKGGYWSIPRMHTWLTVHKGLDIPEQTIWYRMDKLKYSYKSARPHPIQGDTERQDAFKKGASYHSLSR